MNKKLLCPTLLIKVLKVYSIRVPQNCAADWECFALEDK